MIPVRAPAHPHPINPARPRPLPAPRPNPPAGPKPVPQPQPGRVLNLRLAVALIAVGVLLLTTHYFLPMILLWTLPTREWRKAALTPDRSAPAIAAPWRTPRVGPLQGRVERPVGSGGTA